jgi:hypothetical protein
MAAAAAAGGGAALAPSHPLPARVAGRLAPLTRDISFKRAFGLPETRETLRALLNAVMRPDRAERAIRSIENVEEVKDTVFRSVIYNIRCTLVSGATVIIELQKAKMREQILDRMIGYQAREYAEQWKPGKKTEAGNGVYSLVPVRVLALLDFAMSEDVSQCGTLVQHYHLQLAPARPALDPTQPAPPVQQAAVAALQRLPELSDITIVQLPLAPGEEDLESAPPEGKWAHLLHHSHLYTVDDLPAPLKEGAFLAAAESARYDKMTAVERRTLAAEAAEEESLREFLDEAEARERAEAALEHEKAERERERAAAAAALAAAAERERAAAERERAAAAELEAMRAELASLKLAAQAGPGSGAR